MIRHLVLMKVCRDGSEEERRKTVTEIRRSAEQLPSNIPQVKDFSIGVNVREGGFHICMDSSFDSMEALHEYLIHPAHQKTAAYINTVSYELTVFDYEY